MSGFLASIIAFPCLGGGVHDSRPRRLRHADGVLYRESFFAGEGIILEVEQDQSPYDTGHRAISPCLRFCLKTCSRRNQGATRGPLPRAGHRHRPLPDLARGDREDADRSARPALPPRSSDRGARRAGRHTSGAKTDDRRCRSPSRDRKRQRMIRSMRKGINSPFRTLALNQERSPDLPHHRGCFSFSGRVQFGSLLHAGPR